MYAVIGATGNTGRLVAEALLAARKDVLAIGRSEERLRPLIEMGAEVFVGSVDDAQAMAIAFSGAEGVYCLIPPRFDVEDYRSYQKTVGEALAAAINEAGVRHVVLLSSVGGQHTEGTGPIAGLREQEDRLGKLDGVNVLSLRAGWFMENLYMNIGTIREVGVMGAPVRGDLPIPMIATRDIGSYAAERLVALDFDGNTSRELLGARDVTLQEAAATIGAAIGKDDLQYVEFPFDEFEKGMLGTGISQGSATLFSEMYRAFNGGLVVAEEERSPENTTPTTIEEFARTFSQVYAASGGS